ncbi:hypothetical protein LOTGIDRAFT_126606 [Lottia gigantea]|uniref:F-box domain-containing protein n=1 Tax=Lottia gigantea TaxID=225164 RepID=V4BHI4_LOTGI|nr:hypothetical protein LOTGIDRAFT_126606 [Lottia gigantea]ESO88154.1 hypothetical protein LOTGIDRAFT_126606 [Lottia gigantea]
MCETIIEHFPDSILLHIFSFLNGPDLCSSAQVCKRWRNVAYDDSLYRNLLKSLYKIDVKNGLANDKESWRSEYKRLFYHCPTVWSEELLEHTDEVLHVSFSHNGLFFSTTSKDCSVKVWEVGYPTKMKYDYQFGKDFLWDFTQFSCFNGDDTKLLVSSVRSSVVDRRGYVAILSLEKNFELLKIVNMDPSQLFGAWLNSETFLGGSLHINLENQGALVNNNDKYEPVEDDVTGQVLFTFSNETASLIKCLMVFKNHTSHCMSCASNSEPMRKNPSEEDSNCYLASNGHDDICKCCGKLSSDSKKDNSVSSAEGHSFKSNCDTRLLYVTGNFSVALHQIGVNTIPSDLSHHSATEDLNSDDIGHMVMHLGKNEIEIQPNRKPDSWDQMIDLNGHVTGLCLSDNKRYLYVNCRPWVGKVDREDPWSTPLLSEDIEVRVIDLHTLTDTGIRYTGHKGLSPSTMCCFVFLHTSHDYVASGSEDSQGYLWDKHYRCLLSTFQHGEGVVNAVAFNPRDQEYLVTVSDDHSIQIWRSKYKMSKLPKLTE